MKKKIYTLKPTKKQLEIMKRYWKTLQSKISSHLDEVRVLEAAMEEQTGIEGIEFFETESGIVGIGNVERTMKLFQETDLEKR